MTDERWNDRILRVGGQANAWIERGMGWKILEIPADDLMRLLLEREEALVKVETWENAMRQAEEGLKRPVPPPPAPNHSLTTKMKKSQ